MRYTLLLIAGGITLIAGITSVLVAPGRIDRALTPDDTSLQAGLDAAIQIVEETAVSVDTPAPFEPTQYSADPERAGELKNNYRLSDQSEPHRLPGFDDCDSWRNLVDDGWRATYELQTLVPEDWDSAAALDSARRFWTSRGFEVDTHTQEFAGGAFTHVWAKTDIAHIRFRIEEERNEVTIQATTFCLSPA